MRTSTFFVVFIALFAGCGGDVLTHPSKGAAEFAVELNECERDFAAMQDRWAAGYAVRRCLASKGWRQQ